MGSTLSRRRGDQHLIDDTEKAQSGLGLSAPLQYPTRIPLSFPSRERNTKPTQFRDDAKIWRLYLEEAEEKAKDKAILWNTGLDSLLIFAGLFAGVVSSFVIDARSELEPANEIHILTGILDVLRGGSVGQLDRVRTPAYWVSGLWTVSLFITIFSAIMGVLAKAWLAKYTPTANRGEASDAYRRYKLDKQAEHWHLREVLIVAPLLVQIASALFLAGLVIQTHGDSPSIGKALLSFCVAGGLIYIVITVVPLLIPTSPFNTPVSELLDALFTNTPESEDQSEFKADIDEGLGDILYMKLILSPKASHTEGAFAEIALPSFRPEWRDFLCKTNAPKVLLSHFRERAVSSGDNEAKQEEILCNYLLALLSFAELYEEKLRAAGEATAHSHPNSQTTRTDKAGALSDYSQLDGVLRDSLKPGNPLHRWNELPDALRPLLFALRTNVLRLLQLPRARDAATKETPTDFDETELSERPWEMSLQEIRSSHRIHFTVAACRGLVEGDAHLKTISSFTLSLFLARAALNVLKARRSTEWASGLTSEKRGEVNSLAATYISKLFEATVEGWEGMAADALKDISSIVVPSADGGAIQKHFSIPSILILGFSQSNHDARVHAIKMLQLIATPGQSLLSGISEVPVESIAKMAVYDDETMQDDGLTLLMELAEADEPPVLSALVKSIQLGLRNYEEAPRASTVRFIEKLHALKVKTSLVSSSIKGIVSDLVKVALDDNVHDSVQVSALRLCGTLSSAGFEEVKKSVLGRLHELLHDEELHDGNKFLRALTVAIRAKDAPSHDERLPYTFLWPTPTDFLRVCIPYLMARILGIAIHESSRLAHLAAQELLQLISQDGLFKGSLTVEDKLVLEGLDTPHWRVRHNALLIVRTLAKQVDLTPELLKRLVKTALADGDSDVRSEAVDSILALLRDHDISDDLDQELKTSIADHVSHIHEAREQREQEKFALFLSSIANLVQFPEAITNIMSLLGADRTRSPGFIEQVAIFLTSDKFTQDPAYVKAFKDSVPPELDVILPEARGSNKRSRWVKLLAMLLRNPVLGSFADGALQGVLKSLKSDVYCQGITATFPGVQSPRTQSWNDADPNIPKVLQMLLSRTRWANRVHWVETFACLVEHFPGEFPGAPRIILGIAMSDSDHDVRSASLRALRPLVNLNETTTNTLWDGVISHLDELAEASDWELRFALAQLLAAVSRFRHSELSTETINTLMTIANKDRSHDVRSELIKAMSALSQQEDPEQSKKILDTFGKGMMDKHWKPRQCWVESIAPYIRDAESPAINVLFRAAIADDNDQVRNEASRVLHQLDSTLRDAIATQIGKSLATELENPECHASAKSLLTRLTTPTAIAETSSQEAYLSPGREMWIHITTLLGRNSFEGVAKIIEMAIKDAPTDNFNDLKAVFQRVTMQSPIQKVLPLHLDLSLGASESARSDALDLLDGLLCPDNGRTYESLMDTSDDAQLMARLASISVKDGIPRFREHALKLLKTLFDNHRFQDTIISSWSKLLETCLSDHECDHEAAKYRKNAISILHDLTISNSPKECDKFKGVVLMSLPSLLKITLLVPRDRVYEGTRKEAEEIRKGAEGILLENLATYHEESRLNGAVLSAIPAMIPAATAEGKRMALLLVEHLQVSDETAASIAHELTPLLHTSSPYTRRVAMELLSILYSQHGLSQPQLIESAIPDIISLALDEKDDVGDLRMTAIQLLIALSKSQVPASPTTSHPTVAPKPFSVVNQILPLADKFMALLRFKNLRSSVVQLLSLMAVEASVRRAISLQIIRVALAFGTDPSESLQAHIELLAHLVSDGRFGDEPTDNIILFLSSAIVMRPELARYRFQILTALWCHYRSKKIEQDISKLGDDSATMYLVKWFTFALFGKHATTYEVETWLKRCGAWVSGDTKSKHRVDDSDIKKGSVDVEYKSRNTSSSGFIAA